MPNLTDFLLGGAKKGVDTLNNFLQNPKLPNQQTNSIKKPIGPTPNAMANQGTNNIANPNNLDYLYKQDRPTSTTSTLKATTPPINQDMTTPPMTNPFKGLGTIPGSYTNAGPDQLYQAKTTGMNVIDQQAALQSQNIFDSYKKAMGDTKFKDLQARGEFMNAQQVTDNINKVQKNITEGVLNPVDIAKNTGMNIDTVNRIMQGRGFQDLQLSSTPGVGRERFTQDYVNNLQDLTKQNTRTGEDIQIKQQRLTDQLNNDIADVNRKAGLNISGAQVMGGITGQARNSGYQMGLQNIQQDAQRTITDLTKQWTNQTEDITRLKDRVLEDYNTNTAKMKQSFDRGMDDLRMQGLSLIQDYQNKYGLNTDNFTKAINDLSQGVLKEKLALTDNYMKGMNDYNNVQRDYFKMLQDLHKDQTNVTKVGDYYQMGGQLYTESQMQNISNQQISSFQFGNNKAKLANSAGSSLQEAFATIPGIIVGSTYRTREEQQALYDKYQAGTGGKAAKPGESLHEDGMAADLYGGRDKNGRLIALTKEQDKALEKYGWYNANIPGDAGHHEFRGIPGGTQQGSKSTNSSLNPLFKRYYENGIFPTNKQLEGLGLSPDTFTNLAEQGYTSIKQQEYALKGFDIMNSDVFLNIDPSTRGKLNDSIDGAQTFTNNINALINDVESSGTQRQSRWGEGKKLDQEVTDLALRAKEIYNLGVLNGPDLSLMQNILPNPTGIGAKFQGKDAIITQLKAARDRFQGAIDIKAQNYGLQMKGGSQPTDNQSLRDKIFQ